MTRLGDLTWPEVRTAAVVVVPIGSTEQHGPHLPIDTDTRIAVAVADELSNRDGRLVVAPPISITASGEHAEFPGTLSIGQDALELLLMEMIRSADLFSAVVLVNAHGGNQTTLRRVAAGVEAEGRRVLVVSCGVAGGDAHAGRTETSLLLHLEPEAVRLDRAEPGDLRPWRELGPLVEASGVAAVSPNGVLGDPTGASADEGAAAFDDIVDRLAAVVTGWLDD
jgi:mycofactocin system creatininase family protein